MSAAVAVGNRSTGTSLTCWLAAPVSGSGRHIDLRTFWRLSVEWRSSGSCKMPEFGRPSIYRDPRSAFLQRMLPTALHKSSEFQSLGVTFIHASSRAVPSHELGNGTGGRRGVGRTPYRHYSYGVGCRKFQFRKLKPVHGDRSEPVIGAYGSIAVEFQWQRAIRWTGGGPRPREGLK